MAPNRKNCPNCGKFIRGNSPFCIHCGFQIGEIELEEDFPENSLEMNSSKAKSDYTLQDPKPLFESEQKIYNDPSDEDIISDDDNMNQHDNYEELSLENELDDEETYYEEPMEDEMDDMEQNEIEADSEVIPDDESAFAAILNNQSSKDAPLLSEEKNQSNRSFNGMSEFVKISNVLKKKNGSKDDKIIDTNRNANKTVPKKERCKEEQIKNEQKEAYDANYDNYYDNVIAAVDARINHIQKENVVSTIFLCIAFFIIVIGMIYFLVL